MKITVNSEQEHTLINQLCDIGLRADGIKNLGGVNLILSSIEVHYGSRKDDLGPPKEVDKVRGSKQGTKKTKQGTPK